MATAMDTVSPQPGSSHGKDKNAIRNWWKRVTANKKDTGFHKDGKGVWNLIFSFFFFFFLTVVKQIRTIDWICKATTIKSQLFANVSIIGTKRTQV